MGVAVAKVSQDVLRIVPKGVAFDDRRWYAVITQRCRETTAEWRLRDQGYEVWLPMAKDARAATRRAGPIVALVPAFPRYLFVGVAELQAFPPILSTRGVSDIVRLGERPAIIPVDDIKALYARFARDGGQLDLRPPKVELPKLAPGEPVQIEDGPFAGHPAQVHPEFEELGETSLYDRIKILLSIFGRATTAEVSRGQVARIGSGETASTGSAAAVESPDADQAPEALRAAALP